MTHSVWRILGGGKIRQTRKAESKPLYNHEGRRPRRPTSEPEPQRRRTALSVPTQPAEADVQEAQAGGASFINST